MSALLTAADANLTTATNAGEVKVQHSPNFPFNIPARGTGPDSQLLKGLNRKTHLTVCGARCCTVGRFTSDRDGAYGRPRTDQDSPSLFGADYLGRRLAEVESPDSTGTPVHSDRRGII